MTHRSRSLHAWMSPCAKEPERMMHSGSYCSTRTRTMRANSACSAARRVSTAAWFAASLLRSTSCSLLLSFGSICAAVHFVVMHLPSATITLLASEVCCTSCHLCQRCLRLGEPELHLHVPVLRDGGRQLSASLLWPSHLGI